MAVAEPRAFGATALEVPSSSGKNPPIQNPGYGHGVYSRDAVRGWGGGQVESSSVHPPEKAADSCSTMVFFNCNACGQTVKKNQVEKHYLTACRSCDMLSCLDCGKDFWGDDYKTHTQCISEEDKYGGKGITGHRMTKGEAKQDAWLKQVQKSMNDANASPQVRNLWERLSQYSNIPRKKSKFENFVKNSLRIHNNHLVTQVWEVFSAAQQQQQKEQQDKQKSESEQKDKEVIKDQLTEEKNLDSDSKEDSGKISKRQRKEERRLKANKKEKKDRSKENAKKKKRKHQDLEEDMGKEKIAEDSTKFPWESVISTVLLKADDHELSVKKLRKKVLAEFHAQGGDGKTRTEEKLLATFDKKINKNQRFKVTKDRVKLVQ
ncbi:hypothetical protein Bbelb_294620 [Branchiostoma belcheri]|nr:hypothetical protein Bbelb_294620 [Branchiostoma belcheri]